MAGRKVFSAGEVLQAADVNDFLMDQSVMVFAGTAARGSAIPSPTEGMVTYLSDSDVVQVYKTDWEDVGVQPAILQVVSTTKTDSFATSSTSMVDVTGFSASITPSSTSSKILIVCNISYGQSNAAAGISFNLVRGASTIAQGTGGVAQATVHPFPQAEQARDVGGFNFLDSPATTSATTYKIQAAVSSATGYVNRGFTDVRGISTITLMEVAG